MWWMVANGHGKGVSPICRLPIRFVHCRKLGEIRLANKHGPYPGLMKLFRLPDYPTPAVWIINMCWTCSQEPFNSNSSILISGYWLCSGIMTIGECILELCPIWRCKPIPQRSVMRLGVIRCIQWCFKTPDTLQRLWVWWFFLFLLEHLPDRYGNYGRKRSWYLLYRIMHPVWDRKGMEVIAEKDKMPKYTLQQKTNETVWQSHIKFFSS